MFNVCEIQTFSQHMFNIHHGNMFTICWQYTKIDAPLTV